MTEKELHIHLDMVGGIAGDMFVAAALDAGLIEREELESQLAKIGLGEIEIEVKRVIRGAIEGVKIEFRGWDPAAEADHRHLSTIRAMLADSDLDESVKRRATAMFEILGRAEAAVHGMDVDDVHFHEVGAVDSILDFVAAAQIIESTGASWSVGVVPVGSGTIETAHGTIPVPAPATARVLEGFDVEYRNVEREFVTPTGATIVATVAELDGECRGKMVASGFGCGSRDVEGISNVLRLVVLQRDEVRSAEHGEIPDDIRREDVVQLVTEIDDETAEVGAHVASLLMERGALDVVREPVHMKKGRLATRVSVLCEPVDEEKFARLLLRETTTLGVRRIPIQRWVLPREEQSVDTEFGEVTIKVARWAGEVLKVSPEYESCARLAAESAVPIREVFAAAVAASRAAFGDSPPSQS